MVVDKCTCAVMYHVSNEGDGDSGGGGMVMWFLGFVVVMVILVFMKQWQQ